MTAARLMVLAIVASFVCATGPAVEAAQAPAPSTTHGAEYEWHLQKLVSAYDRFGRHDARWDEPAHQMLRGWASQLSRELGPPGDEQDTIRGARLILLKSKCDDPMVLYIIARNIAYWHTDPKANADIAMRAAEGIRDSQYHPLFKCFAFARAAEAEASSSTNLDAALQRARKDMDEAVAQIPAIVADPHVPRADICDVMAVIGEASLAVCNDRQTYAAKAFKLLDANSKDRSVVLTVDAGFHVEYAWDARGGGWAENVNAQNLKLMEERLDVAAAAGEVAFNLDHKNVLGPLAMLSVELGQGQGKARMETWFERALAADPDCYSACSSKLQYLSPVWYGSIPEMIAFGRECLKKGNWNGGIPLILVDAHLAAAHYDGNDYQQKVMPSYFRTSPDAWKDVQSVYEPYLKQFPKSLYHRSRYAEIACWAGDWKKADEQFHAMGDQFSHSYFRNVKHYHQVRAEVAAHLSDETGSSTGGN